MSESEKKIKEILAKIATVGTCILSGQCEISPDDQKAFREAMEDSSYLLDPGANEDPDYDEQQELADLQGAWQRIRGLPSIRNWISGNIEKESWNGNK